jgi:hypothetical protein
VAAILAITSAFAHGSPTSTGRSMVATIVNAATGASMVSFEDPAPTTVADEQTADAEEAAELAARIAAEQAKLAAEQAEEAAEAAATACTTADQTEDTSEKASDQSEDTTETSATESATEDTAEQTARQATDKPEDASEIKCASAEGEHHSDGDSQESSTKTFSSEGDH